MIVKESELRYIINEAIDEISSRLAGYTIGRREYQLSNAASDVDKDIALLKDRNNEEAYNYNLFRNACEMAKVSMDTINKICMKLGKVWMEKKMASVDYQLSGEEMEKAIKKEAEYFKNYYSYGDSKRNNLQSIRAAISDAEYGMLLRFWKASEMMEIEAFRGREEGKEDEESIRRKVIDGDRSDPRGDIYLPMKDRILRK